MAEPLSPIERKVYTYLLDFLAENTYQPSIREIGRKFRIKSTKTVSDLLQSLSAKGYIERDPSRSRGVRLVGYNGPTRVQSLPVHDGAPLSHLDGALGHVAFDRRFVPCDDAFMLRVKGDALKSRGILDGDYVMVSPSADPHDGDLVAVRFGEETSVRPFGAVDAASAVLDAALDAAQSTTATTTLDNAFSVVGVICGVFRPYHDRDAAPLDNAAFEGAITT